ncbi:hypothetical protein [Pseudomonas sp. PGPPP2]|uniref:hypothetical protein n=1 Tax=Pseudomonas sp. PGPPP2 TaxID=2015554 RepID=UPI000BC956BE|nr:hypothetical protein [Pseudomonas sp. PGPPP2]OYT78220.1 MAG: hypothetical protein CFE48_16400 [Pseudomonas sp. PGPPP2]
MTGILVDTSTWWHWFSLLAGRSFGNSKQEAEATAFGHLYDRLTQCQHSHPFLYNARVLLELPEDLRIEFDRLVKPYARLIPIPLSRTDGAYQFDGSILMGGRMGGSLSCLLNMDGYAHEEKLLEAANSGKHRNLYDAKERRREFDIEHLESALEAGASHFVTTDSIRIQTIVKAASLWPESKPVADAARICCLPSTALAAFTGGD